MSERDDRLLAAKKRLVGFRQLLDFQNATKKDIGIDNAIGDYTTEMININSFNEFIMSEEYLDSVNSEADNELNELPALCKTYDGSGKLVNGIPRDFGFNLNGSSVLKKIGSRWNEIDTGITARMWTAICFGNDLYVAISSYSDVFAYSTDGITWTETSTLIKTDRWYAICYNNGLFIALPNNTDSRRSIYSTDGITWVSVESATGGKYWMYLAGNSSIVVASSWDSNTFAYSTDGITWTETNNGLSVRNWRGLVYGDTKYVAVAYNSNTFAYSTDGITWTETNNGISDRYWYAICYGDNKYVTIEGGPDLGKYIAYSDNGLQWTQILSSELNSRDWNTISYSPADESFVAVGYNSDAFAYSSDGISWKETNNAIKSREWMSVCSGHREFIAIPANTTIFAKTTRYDSYATIRSQVSKKYEIFLTNAVINFSNNDMYIYIGEKNDAKVDVGPTSVAWRNALLNKTLLFFDILPITNTVMFASYDMSQADGGAYIWLTTDFVKWIEIGLISYTDYNNFPELLNSIKPNKINRETPELYRFEEFINRYFRPLPNNQFILMDPVKMYSQAEPHDIMASIYSVYTGEKLLDIHDPYGDNDWQAKAISGLVSGITENGDIILAYANRLQNTAIELYLGRSMETLYSDPEEVVNVPSVGRFYDVYEAASAPLSFSAPSASVDLAVSVLESKNNSLADSDIPTAAVSIALGDKAQQIQSENKFNNVSLFIKSVSASGMRSDELNNIDVDYSSFITGNNDESNSSALITLISNHDTISTKIPDISNLSNIRQRVTTFGTKLFQGAKHQNNPSI